MTHPVPVGDVQISVIMPVHNAAPFLETRLASLLSQTDVAIEVIAVDDGSTDASLAMLQAHALVDARLIVIEQPQRGPSAARNTGMTLARGEWITFADADDWMAPDALAGAVALAAQQQLDVLIGNGFRFTADPTHEEPRPLLTRQPWGEVMTGSQWIVHAAAADEWPHYVWLQLIRRSFIEAHGLRFIPDMLHEDILWTTQLGLAASRVGFDSRANQGYRRNPVSIVNSPERPSLMRRAESYLRIIGELVDLAHGARDEPGLRRALLRQANTECLYFDALLRRDLTLPDDRRHFAAGFHQLQAYRSLLGGTSGLGSLRRLLRCFATVARFRR